jgi:transposase
MKPDSLDLRQKIIEAYQNSEGSQRQLARRFKVSLGFIQNLLTRYRQDGTLEPRPKQNGFPPKLAAHESLVKELVEQFPDATLKELTDTLAQKGDIQVSVSTLHYYLERLKLTRKKNSSRRAS